MAGENIYTRIGIRPVINAIGVVTILGGSIMPPEVMQAMEEAAKFFVPLPELQKKAGARIAELVGVPAAMVTAGCASSITVATAACIARGDAERLSKLPDTSGMKNEIVQQKSHLSGYEAQMQLVGAKIVWVETREELDRAINERTAMMFFLNYANSHGQIQDAEFVEIGKKMNIPTFNDCAADVHPVENVSKWIKMGFDLVCFSGGKGLMAPQSSGLLLGRADLIAGARANNSPTSATIGRGMKVNKEEMLGIMVALESFLERDHDKEWAEWERRANLIIASANSVPGVKAEMYLPEIFNRWPHIRVTWDEAANGIKRADVAHKLRAGEPSIFILSLENALDLGVITLKPGEDKIVARRLVQELRAGA